MVVFLGRRDNESDLSQLAEYEIPEIDIVIVDLYPFEKTVASGAAEQDIIEKIDIGGISLIRAAAKNFKDVICVSSMKQYDEFLRFFQKMRVESARKQEEILQQKLSLYRAITTLPSLNTLILKPATLN